MTWIQRLAKVCLELQSQPVFDGNLVIISNHFPFLRIWLIIQMIRQAFDIEWMAIWWSFRKNSLGLASPNLPEKCWSQTYHLERIDGATPIYWFIMAPLLIHPLGVVPSTFQMV